MAVGAPAPQEYTPRSQPISTGSTMSGSRSHDAAAPPFSWKQPPPVLPTWGSEKSDVRRSKSPRGHTTLPTASTFLCAAKGLHSCKRPHSSNAPRRKSAAPALPPLGLLISLGERHRPLDRPAFWPRSQRHAKHKRNLPTLMNGSRLSNENPDHQGLE